MRKFAFGLIMSFITAVFLFSFYYFSLPDGSEAQNLALKAEILPDSNTVRYEPYVLGLKNPWGMAFISDSRMLVTERSGEIRIVENAVLLEKKVAGVPKVYARGQGGLLDIVLDPNFKKNSLLYLSYSHLEGSGGSTSIMRARLENDRLLDKKVVYKAEPNTPSGIHFGSRIVFDKEGRLYFSIGDRGDRDVNPQDVKRDGGKIYRINSDGSIPIDNPFVDTTGAKKAAFTYGNRNPQGLALHPETGDIWEHEHGPRGGDEINIIKKGLNYGWPIISYGINYSGTTFAKGIAREGMEQPITYYVPSIAPSGMTFITSDVYPKWKGDLILGSLKFGYLVRADVEGDRILMQEKVADGIGRVRSVIQGPDGYLYVGVEGKGVFRLIL